MSSKAKAKSKTVKPVKPEKTKEEREREVDQLMQQFMDFGFPLDHEGVQEFIKITKEFMYDGVSCSGTIQLTGFQRVLKYILSKRPHIVSRIVLEYKPHI
jgi:hypothetical protein